MITRSILELRVQFEQRNKTPCFHRACPDYHPRSFGAIPGGRWRRDDGLAGLREVIPDVRFADRVEVVTRDAGAAAAWSRLSPTIPRP
jgi:hypothetical protein